MNLLKALRLITCLWSPTYLGIVLLGNASQHYRAEEKTTLTAKPQLKALVEDSDISNSLPLLFGAYFERWPRINWRQLRRSQPVQQTVLSKEPSPKWDFIKSMEPREWHPLRLPTYPVWEIISKQCWPPHKTESFSSSKLSTLYKHYFQGYSLDLLAYTTQSRAPPEIHISQEERALVSQEISKLSEEARAG